MALLLLLPLMHNYAIITLCAAQATNNITSDQSALLALKAQITHDPSNQLQTNWSATVSVCNWIGVRCGPDNRRVTALDLSSMNLTATLPPHLGNLSFLASFDLRSNNFHGALPVELANLRRLEYINLGRNGFEGEIPSWFSSFPRLRSLLLFTNNFSGVIPSSFGNLSKLEELSLRVNYLEGQIPITLGNLSNLNSLSLDNNQLSGHLLWEIFDGLPKLKWLSLEHNQISGRIPNSLFKCKELSHLQMFNNSLEGSLPSEIQNLTKLEMLYLSVNNLTGWIPTLPHSLRWFSLRGNKLSGEIPSSICNLRSLEYLDLSMNNLGGIIPNCFENSSFSLQFMSLSINNFYGTIPAGIFHKSCSLQSFLIYSNQFEGLMPQSLANCNNLTILDVGNNNLNGTFPIWLGNLKFLQVVILRANRFHGQIVDSQLLTSNSSFSRLRIIDISLNNFSGNLPSRFFEVLDAMVSNGNELRGEAKYTPFYVGDIGFIRGGILFILIKGSNIMFTKIITTLTIIDFSSNQFFGEIPKTLGQLHSLRALNLSHNGLTGRIPSSVTNLSMLESFDLSSNKLQGAIPEQFKNLKFLAVFNLSLNNLSGAIPQGNQFDTFENDSYIGNWGLCGLPLSKSCNAKDIPPTQQQQFDDAKAELDWKYSIAIGYGCGLVFGLSIGYIVFTTGKPWWIIQTVERVQRKYVRRK